MIRDDLLDLDLVFDNKYLDLYCELILNNLNNIKDSINKIKHHIIPRSYYKQNNLPIKDIDNIVYLSYSNHILAHYYLALSAKPNYFKYSNEYAFLFMTNQKEFKEELLSDDLLKEYDALYADFCNRQSVRYRGKPGWNKGISPKPESIEKMRQTKLAQHLHFICSPEKAQKISQSKIGHSVSEETRDKIRKTLVEDTEQHREAKRINSEKHKNKMWINNGEQQLLIKSDITQHYLEQGWIRGRLPYSKETIENMKKGNKESMNRRKQKGKIVGIHKDGKNKYIPEPELQLWLDKGYEISCCKRNQQEVEHK